MKTFLIGCTVAVGYVLFGKLSAYFGVVNSIININIFLPEGIALAFALIFGRSVIWGIFVGQTIFALLNDLSFFAATSIGIINTVEASIAIFLSKEWKIDLELNDLRSVLRFFMLIALILQPFSALLGNLTLLLFNASKSDMFWIYASSWYIGNLIAQLVVTPMLILFYKAYKKHSLNIKKLVLTAIFFTLFIYFLVVVLRLENMALLLSATIVALIIVGYYFGTVYGAVAINIISMLMVFLTQNGIGAFTVSTKFDNIVNLNFYMIAQIAVFYVNQAMYREKEGLLVLLKKQNEVLERRVAEEIAKNREKEKYLMYQSRLAQMGEIINMIAHQWRQPLNSLAILVQTIGLKFKKGLLSKEEMGRLQKEILQKIDYMSETIDSFRNFFKPEKEAVEFNLRDALSQVVDMSKSDLEKNSIAFEFYQDDDFSLSGYPNELGQALLNIINNAKDQILLKNPKEKKISLHVKSEGRQVAIEIADTAGGIEDENKEKIFEPYFSTKEGKNGTGLGLYITKMIVEEHMNGKIYAENSDKGAVFTIELPIMLAKVDV